MSTTSRPAAAVPATRPSRPGGRSRRGAVIVAVLVALFALVGASCKQLDPNNRTAAVPGVTNGNLPMAYLASTSGGCVVYDESLNSLNAMIAQAAKDGVNLKPLSCYRDYAGQVAARDEWCAKGACQMAAVPGTSNHGWGKAVDFRDQSGELTFDSAGYAWMTTWAGYYGWIHPKGMEQTGPVPEAWHWEWIGDGGKMFPGEYFGIGNGPLASPRGQPFGNLESVEVGSGTISVSGWAIDPDQVASIPVHVYIDQASDAVTANGNRPDVNAAFPLYAGAQHGFSGSWTVTPGDHKVCVYAINVSGTGFNALLGCRTVTVPDPSASSTAGPTTTTTAPAAPAAVAATTTVAPATTSTASAPAQAAGSPTR